MNKKQGLGIVLRGATGEVFPCAAGMVPAFTTSVGETSSSSPASQLFSCPLARRPSPGCASAAIIRTAAPRSVIYKPKTL